MHRPCLRGSIVGELLNAKGWKLQADRSNGMGESVSCRAYAKHACTACRAPEPDVIQVDFLAAGLAVGREEEIYCCPALTVAASVSCARACRNLPSRDFAYGKSLGFSACSCEDYYNGR